LTLKENKVEHIIPHRRIVNKAAKLFIFKWFCFCFFFSLPSPVYIYLSLWSNFNAWPKASHYVLVRPWHYFWNTYSL